MPGFPIPLMYFPEDDILADIIAVSATNPTVSITAGTTWTPLGSSNNAEVVARNRNTGRILTLDNNTTNGACQYSDDNGATWTAGAALPFTGVLEIGWRYLAWIPYGVSGLFVASNQGNTNAPSTQQFAYSVDGVSAWTAVNVVFGMALTRGRGMAYAENSGRLCFGVTTTAGNAIYYSDDGGATWTQATINTTGLTQGNQWTIASDGTGFTAILSRGSDYVARGYHSADGITWTADGAFPGMAVTAQVTAKALSYSSAAGAYLAAFTNGHVVTFNGTAWTTYLSKLPSSTWNATLGLDSDARFLACASAGTASQRIAYTDDLGVTWTQVDPGGTLALQSMTLTEI